MGLPMGGEIEIISTDGGPMVVAAKGCRLALGRGLAQKIMVSPCRDNGDA
jgi:Fe2+ transport system protein FeoA